MRVAKVVDVVADKIHLFLGFSIFFVGVLIFNSAIALIVSISLILYGIFADSSLQKTSDLSYIFKDSSEKSHQGAGMVKESNHQPVKVMEHNPKPDWTVALLQEMDWKRFEDLCCQYFSVVGFKSVQTGLGADGGVDIHLYKDESDKACAAVQCKAWSDPVGVDLIRSFFGVMTHENLSTGYFVSTSTFYQSAKEFAKGKDMHLIDGNSLIKMIKALPEEKQIALYKLSTEGDYTTPTCASCGIKMVLRQGKSGQFWGCKKYPRCKNRLKIKHATKRQTNSPGNMLY